MGVTRRQFLTTISACVAAAACARHAAAPRTAGSFQVLHRVPGGAAAATILVLMPDTPQTKAVWTGLSDETAGEFNLVAVRVQDRHSAATIAEAIRQTAPSALVLMNNPTVSSYRRYLERSDALRGLPTVVVMTSFIEPSRLQSMGAVGISYEVPLITVVTNLRRIVASPVERVGVVCRPALQPFLAGQRELARREQIQVVPVVTSADPNPSELKHALRFLKPRADALWILNDDRLLSPQLIADGWLPGLNERPWRPTIVGAASLVSAGQSLGTFAVLPDHTALGIQTANVIFDIADKGFLLAAGGATELPVSTTTTIDLAQVRERFVLREGAMAQVDRVVE